jgi:NAD(P)-dependent dehydrogenase (short-subunit alcohol dehydrogenase family)
MKIANKTVLITGANRGIGQALVNEALNRGAKRVYAAVRGDFQHADKRATSLKLDVTSASQIQQAAAEVGALDVLINNAGIVLYDDLTSTDALEQQLAVNLFGPLKVTHAFLPQLKKSRGAIVNNASLGALAAIPIIPGYSISKAAAFNMTQSLRALLAGEGVSVHAVIIGPTDTEMNRAFDIPKVSTETTAKGIFDGIEKGEEDIFPDPASHSIAEGWRNCVVKAMERQFAGFVPASVAKVA